MLPLTQAALMIENAAPRPLCVDAASTWTRSRPVLETIDDTTTALVGCWTSATCATGSLFAVSANAPQDDGWSALSVATIRKRRFLMPGMTVRCDEGGGLFASRLCSFADAFFVAADALSSGKTLAPCSCDDPKASFLDI